MQVSIISIGNSKGLRLSKTILKQYHIQDKVELILEEDCIVIRPVAEPRQGWSDAFARMHAAGDDALLMDDVWDDDDWGE